MLGLLFRWVVIAAGVFVAAHTSKGISYDNNQTLALVVLVLSLLNLFAKPLLVFFALPFVLVTFGIGLWFINAGLLMLTAKLVEGFHVESFFVALWGSLVISALSLLAGLVCKHMEDSNCRCCSHCGCRKNKGEGDSCCQNKNEGDSCCR